MSQPTFDLSLYLVTDPELIGDRPLVEVVRAAVAGGVTLVQLRDKDAPTRTLLEVATALKATLDPLGVPLIVNDRIDVALAVGAAGVHVGQTDMPAELARRLIGPDVILGVSILHPDEARAIDPAIVDYVGLGPIFPTTTKKGAPPAMTAENFAAVRRLVDLPTVAIGGINARNAAQAFALGADGIAVVSAICAAPDPTAAARELKELVETSQESA